MILKLERSKDFWTQILDDPSVSVPLSMTTEDFLRLIDDPSIFPYASQNGGYLITDVGIGLISEFHGIFRKEGRGKEAFEAACSLAEIIFKTHSMAITYESNNPNSKPPLSFGFKRENTQKETPIGPLKLWSLTKSQWISSPVYKRIVSKCHQPS